MNPSKIASTIEHTFLKPTATAADIEQLCKEAQHWKFHGVCVNSVWIELAVNLLGNSNVKIISTAAFPLGASATPIKCREVEFALSRGAHEVDFVINIGWLKSGDLHALAAEFRDLVETASGKPLKVILETCFLTEQEKKIACQLAVGAGISFVKTSTGYGPTGATIDDVKLMKSLVGDKTLVKASGGIRDYETAQKMLQAGADRLGTSSGIAILQGIQEPVLNQK